MEIKAVDGKLSIGSLFVPIAAGYAIGARMIFLPMFLLVGLTSILSTATGSGSDQAVSTSAMFLPMAIMLPVILLLQAIMYGGIILLGLSIYRNWGTLKVTSVRETPEA